MENTAILAPAAALVVWSIIMLFWMVFTRFPAMKAMRQASGKTGSVSASRPGGRGQDLEGRIPDHVNWKAHNFTHLMEQPTLFYATVLMLAIMGPTSDTVIAAWIYTGLRVVHSLWQALVNTIPVRLALFTAGTLALVYLALRALFLALA
ncbi:MAPEG family protein [Paraurantiacibacter namhicola]|uniref:MAPEG family protein n=1 Tax=Paraurantiacibacter namhicola TaxID=645517 RepID=A0A1C7DA77_9SPHN|nr:MAPEG family protein [Paraurantiacibacter namhicola]ANU08221.1 MAPEG family protein [Paraurantiacibacter namhicola]